jgi:hypothetical protein
VSAWGSLEYALARMQARLGRRPREAAWRSIERSRGLAPILEICHATTLDRVATALPASPGVHDVGAAIREAWQRSVAEAAAWMPMEFDRAISWLRMLPLLPAFEHLARGGEATDWMRVDADLAAPGSWSVSANPTSAWRAEWEHRMPRRALEQAPLAHLVRDVDSHLARFRTAPVHDAPTLRRELEGRLVAEFRRNPLESSAAFAWLGLLALDLERLRGELERRIAFPHARWLT